MKKLRQITITERSCAGIIGKEIEECDLKPPDEVKWAFDKARVEFKAFRRSTPMA